MRLFRAGLGVILKLGATGAVILLALALVWTARQAASARARHEALRGTTEARREAYRGIATAINIERQPANLRRGSSISLLQHGDGIATPESTPAPLATPAPDAFRPPTLLLPLAPDEGLRLSGTLVPRRAPEVHRAHRLVNILLLGSDEELSEDNFIRTDTMIVLSLNVETGAVSMLSLPRDLFVYIPHGQMARLNTAFGWGEKLEWDPGRGFGLLRQTLFYNFGINAHYYARVDFSGFQAIIDRLGGVDIAVDCAYQDYYPVGRDDDGAAGADGYRLRTLPVGYYTFDGFDALWYARTRKRTDDFDRGRRHQLLVRAIWRKARSLGLAATLPQLWAEFVTIVDTDLPFDLMLRLLPFAVNLDFDDIVSYSFERNYHTREWSTPEGWLVQLPNRDEVAQLMQALYTPPSKYQSALAGATIAVYNGSGEDNWDIVASERLRWGGFNAVALGPMAGGVEIPSSRLTDRIATEKGSLVPGILRALNMSGEQATRQASAEREYDYEVIIGRDYESCTFGVLPLEEE